MILWRFVVTTVKTTEKKYKNNNYEDCLIVYTDTLVKLVWRQTRRYT